MIISDLSQGGIVSAIKNNLAMVMQKNREGRKAERDMLLDFYDGDVEKHVKKFFKSKILKQAPMWTGKLTKQFVDKRSLVYKKAPAVKTDNEKYDLMMKAGGLSVLRRQLEQMRNLEGTMGFLSSWDDLNDRLKWRQLIQFDVYFIPGINEPFAVSYEIGKMGNARESKQRFIFWSKDIKIGEFEHAGLHFRFDNSGETEGLDPNNRDDLENKVKDQKGKAILPVSFVHAQPQSDSFWVPGMTDVAAMHRVAVVDIFEVNVAIRFDALGLKWATGFQQKTTVEFGTETILGLPGENSKMGKLPGANLDNIMKALRDQIEMTGMDNFLKVKFGETGVAPSGVSLRLENLDNLEQRESDVENWRRWELERAQIDDAIIRSKIPGTAPMNLDKYHVDFTESEFPMAPSEVRADTEFNMKMGFTTWKQEMLRRNPDISDEELEERRKLFLAEQNESTLSLETAREVQNQSPIDLLLNA